jgi:hypothetical protein
VPEAAEVLKEWHADQNPMIEFMRENTIPEPGYRLPVARIAEEWAGRPPKIQDLRQVGRWLRDAGYPIADARPTDQGRSVVKCVRDRRFTHKDAAQLVNTDFEPD